jgi:glycosyltransferase involved in cell wall biosynthesis
VALISVITAIHPETPSQYLDDLYQSLLKQDIDFEWLPQWDGLKGKLPKEAQSDPRVLEGCNRDRLYISITRNRALLRSTGEYLRVVDADDVLPINALGKQLEVIEKEAVGFVFGSEAPLDKPNKPQLPRVPLGLVKPVQLEDYWRKHQTIALSHSTILWRKDLIWENGAWPAQTGMEDVSLVLLANMTNPGFAMKDTALYRRAHALQATIQPNFVYDRSLNKAFTHSLLINKRLRLGLDIPIDYQNPPKDINKQLAIKKGESFGHRYSD